MNGVKSTARRTIAARAGFDPDNASRICGITATTGIITSMANTTIIDLNGIAPITDTAPIIAIIGNRLMLPTPSTLYYR